MRQAPGQRIHVSPAEHAVPLPARPAIANADRLPDISDGEQLPGQFIWLDPITPDNSRARDVYRAVLGCEIEWVSDQRGPTS